MKRSKLVRKTPLKRSGFGFKKSRGLQVKRGLRKTRLRAMSPKKAIERKQYAQVKTEWRAECIERDGYHRCEFVGEPFSIHASHSPDGRCVQVAMNPPHHKMGRGKYLSVKKFFMACCFFHHRWIEDNKKAARKLGYILYK